MTRMLKLDDIAIGKRHRKDLGNVSALADSIRNLGLLQSVVVNEKNELIAGQRRIEAHRVLGRTEIRTYVATNLDDALLHIQAECDENTCRKDLAPEEAVIGGLALEKLEKPKAAAKQKAAGEHGKKGGRGKKNPCGNLPQGFEKTRDKVATAVGMSGRTYEKAKAVVKSRDKELIAQMNKTGKVNGAHRKLKAKKRQKAEREAAAAVKDKTRWQVVSSQDVVKCSAVVTDPPYGILNEEWEPGDLEAFTRDWCSRWSSCEADTFLIFWSQRYLWTGREWFDECLDGYEFQQLLVWHYPNNKSPQSQKGFKQTWEPVFFYRRTGADRKIELSGDWGKDLNDFDCHVAAVPQSNFNDAETKQHPAQKPVSVMRWLVNAVTSEGELVVDPFCGSGTTGIAAMQLGRRFRGIETNKEYMEIAKGRIASYGKAV